MAYKRRGAYRRRGYRRRKADVFTSASTLARKAWSGVKAIRRVLNPEHKQLIQLTSSALGSTAQAFSFLTKIAQGDDEGMREGNSLKVTHIRAKCVLSWNVSEPLELFDLVRIVIVKHNQLVPDTAVNTMPWLQSETPQGFLDPKQKGFVTILYDEVHKLNSFIGGKMVDINIPQQQHVYYNGPLNTDIQKNAITLYAVSRNNTYKSNLTCNTLTEYVDN